MGIEPAQEDEGDGPFTIDEDMEVSPSFPLPVFDSLTMQRAMLGVNSRNVRCV